MTCTRHARFPRLARLRVAAEFQAVFAAGQRCSSPLLRLHVLPGEGAPRLGITVSKRVDKRAVGRNRFKRRVRDFFRRQILDLPPGDYVLIAKPEATRAESARLRAELETVFGRARSLKREPAAGTMPPSDAPPDRPPPAS